MNVHVAAGLTVTLVALGIACTTDAQGARTPFPAVTHGTEGFYRAEVHDLESGAVSNETIRALFVVRGGARATRNVAVTWRGVRGGALPASLADLLQPIDLVVDGRGLGIGTDRARIPTSFARLRPRPANPSRFPLVYADGSLGCVSFVFEGGHTGDGEATTYCFDATGTLRRFEYESMIYLRRIVIAGPFDPPTDEAAAGPAFPALVEGAAWRFRVEDGLYDGDVPLAPNIDFRIVESADVDGGRRVRWEWSTSEGVQQLGFPTGAVVGPSGMQLEMEGSPTLPRSFTHLRFVGTGTGTTVHLADDGSGCFGFEYRGEGEGEYSAWSLCFDERGAPRSAASSGTASEWRASDPTPLGEELAASCPYAGSEAGPPGCETFDVGPTRYALCPFEKTWEEARVHCAGTPGFALATLDAEAEHFAVTSRLTGAAWIGAHDREREGAYVGMDGHPLRFARWCPGEPNDDGPGEDCALVGWGDGACWNDGTCGTYLPFVCERAP